MATPTTLPATAVAGEILTAAYVNNLRGAFRIMQVVSATTTTQTAVASTTYISSTLTVNITPTFSSSKFLIVANLNGFVPGANEILGQRIVKTVSAVDTVLLTNAATMSSGAGSLRAMNTQIYLDSPATSSALTYKVEIARASGSGTLYAQLGSEPSTITVFEISA
jgi:hypothetical protein